MKSIPLSLRVSRLLAAMTLLTGISGPAFAKPEKALLSSNKEGASVQRSGTDQTGKSLKVAGCFEANNGQTNASVKFYTRTPGYTLYLTAAEAVMVMPKAAAASGQNGVVRMKLKGANASPAVQGLDIQPGYSNYLIGSDPSKWQTGVKQYFKVKFAQVYPGIDMIYRLNNGQVENDFIVAPGANPQRILIGFEGNKGLRLDRRGNLVLLVAGGELTYKAPALYQTLGSKRVPVKGRYVLASNKNVRFEVGNYIKSRELVIDPSLLYSSFLGGALDDKAYAIAVDNANNAYLTGATDSTDFPSAVGGPIQASKLAGRDIFVTKINPAGTAILWSAYLGGAGDDVGLGIAVNPVTEKVYITGDTTDGGTFTAHTTIGTALTGKDAFVVAINAAGNAVIYANVFGAGGDDTGTGIAVDTLDAVYVTGETTSLAGNSFPYTFGGGVTYTVGAAQTAAGGGASQAFVVKFNATGAQNYGTYLGGTGVAYGTAIAIDSNKNAYITGWTGDEFFTASDWPNVFKKTITGANDAFIAKLDPTGATWLYKTYVGGSNINRGTGIAVDGSSPPNVYITGYTFSADFPGAGFVTVGQTTIGTAPDAFVFKLRTALTGLSDGVYATYLGGSGDDRATGIVLDSSDNAYVTGTTTSGDFPMVGPISGGSVRQGNPEAFVTKLGPTGATKLFSSYVGGTTETDGQGLALDSLKNIYLTGYTNSVTATFPIVAGSFQVANAGGLYDAFITKIGSPAPPPVCSITSISPVTGFRIGGTTVTINITNFTGFSGAGVTFGGENAQPYSANASSTVITAVSPRHPLTGALTAGSVPLTVTGLTGACSTTYRYAVEPLMASGACGEDFFYPSPATGATAEFAYCMNLSGTAKIRIYNVIGDLAAKLEHTGASGPQSATLNTSKLAPGVYLYRLEKDYVNGTSSTSSVKKFVVKH